MTRSGAEGQQEARRLQNGSTSRKGRRDGEHLLGPPAARALSSAGGLVARGCRGAAREHRLLRRRAGEVFEGRRSRRDAHVGPPDESREPLRRLLLLRRRFHVLFARAGSHPGAGHVRPADDGRGFGRAELEGDVGDTVRLHHQEGHQVLRRIDADRRRRGVLHERPPRPEDRLEDGRLLRQRRLDQKPRQPGHRRPEEAQLQLAVHTGREPGPRVLAEGLQG